MIMEESTQECRPDAEAITEQEHSLEQVSPL